MTGPGLEAGGEQCWNTLDVPGSRPLPPKPALYDFCRISIFSPIYAKVTRLWTRDPDPAVRVHSYARSGRDMCSDGENGCAWCGNFVQRLLRKIEWDMFGPLDILFYIAIIAVLYTKG